MWTKIILLLSLWWIWRVAARMIRRPRREPNAKSEPRAETGEAKRDGRDLDNLTRQDISDADYEEIP